MRKNTIFLLLTIVLVGCSSEMSTNTSNLELVESIILTPETIIVGEKITLTANVTQGGKPVDDATVDFEVGIKGGNTTSNTNGEFKGNGTYQIVHTFNEPGVYEVIAHTYARDMHTMPLKEIKVIDNQ